MFEMNKSKAKILVTGASGMLGSDLCPMLEENGYEVIKTNSKTLDLIDKSALTAFFENLETLDIVIHCAAYTNVDKAEDDYDCAFALNTSATSELARICAERDILLIYISTDYVFDGEKKTPYLTTDLPNPINVYGLTKFKGEEEIKKHCKKFYIARTSWLYGKHGKNFVETMISLKDNENLKVVDDQIGSPTSTLQLSRAILKLVESTIKPEEPMEKQQSNNDIKFPYGIYHLSSSGSVSWYGFAQEIFRQLNLKTNLKPCTTQDFPRKAQRPKYSVMDNSGLIDDWKCGLLEYLKTRTADKQI